MRAFPIKPKSTLIMVTSAASRSSSSSCTPISVGNNSIIASRTIVPGSVDRSAITSPCIVFPGSFIAGSQQARPAKTRTVESKAVSKAAS